MTRRMLRYTVVVTSGPQTLNIGGDPVHVAAARLGVGPDAQHIVEFWAEGELDDVFNHVGEHWRTRTFAVFGTSHRLPDNAVWRGTTDRTPEGLVWHLYETGGG